MRRTLLVTGLILAVFAIPAWFLTADQLRYVLSAGLIIACLFGLVRWLPAAIEVYRKRASQRPSLGIFGVNLFLISVMLTQCYAIVAIGLGRPVWLMETDILNFITYMLLVAATLFVSSTRLDGERPNKVSALVATIIAAIGVLLGGFGSLIVAKLPGLITVVLHGL